MSEKQECAPLGKDDRSNSGKCSVGAPCPHSQEDRVVSRKTVLSKGHGERDKLEVEFSLRTKNNPIGVAEYKLYQSLPDDLKGKLPTSRQLTDGLKC